MKQHTWQTHHTVDIHTQVIIHKTQWQSHHTWHLHIFHLLVSSSVVHALDTSLIFITPLSCYSGISHFVLLLSLSLIESCCCCVSRLFSTIVRVSALLLLSSPLIFFSFICCPWGARRWGEIRGRIDETDRHLTVCVMNRSRCWGTSLAICFCFCPIHDPTVPSLSVHIT